MHSTEYRQFAFVYECASEGDSCAGTNYAILLHVRLVVLQVDIGAL